MALAAGGLVGLGLLAALHQPPTVLPSQADRFEGQTVCVEGRLAWQRRFESGATQFLVERENRSLEAHAFFALPAATGDWIRACGTLERILTSLELVLRNQRDFHRLQEASDVLISLQELALEPWKRAGQTVATQGVLERTGGRLFLRDPGTSLRLRTNLTTDDELPLGRFVFAQGTLEYDENESSFRLRTNLVRAIAGPPGE